MTMAGNSVTIRLGVDGNAQVEAAIKKIGETTKRQFDDASKSVGLARHEMINLGRQAQDIAVSLAGGQSPLMVLMQQGTQVADILGTAKGGAGAAVADLGSRLASLVTPARAAGAAIAAASAVAVEGLLRWQRAQDALTVSLNGLGRASGLTIGQVNAVAGRSAATSGMSINAAQGLAAQFLGAGVPGGALGGAIGVTRDFGRKLGLSQEDTAGTLARALADPAKGAQELADKFGLLTRAQRLQIEQTAGMGDKAAAAAKLVETLRSRLAELEDPTWRLSRIFEDMGARVSNFVTRTGEGLAGQPSASTVFGRMRRASGAQQQAQLDNATDRLSALLNLAQDAELASKAITATTYAEREAVLIEKARVEALRDSANALRINTQAEAERSRMLAEATVRAQEYHRQTARTIAGYGKTSYERARQQIIDEREDLLRQMPSDDSAAPRRPAQRRVARGPSQMDVLQDELARRGLDPTEANFQKLIDEGVGGSIGRGIIPVNDVGAKPTLSSGRSVRRGAIADADANLRALDEEARAAPLRQANDDLAAYNRLLDAQAAAFGKSAGEAARLQREQELLNQYTREHIPITSDMRAQIAQTAEEWGRYVERLQRVQEKNAELIQSLDQVRGTASSALSSFVGDLVRGESAGAALNRVLDQILQTAINIAAQKLTEGLFGKGGSNGSDSFFGQLFSSFFSSGPASVVGGAGSLAVPTFAKGGVMTSAGPLPLHRYGWGGVASSPQLAMFGEGARPEAYVPLPDGRSIPAVVDLKGLGQDSAPRISIQNYAGVRVEPRVTRDEIRFMIREEQNRFAQGLPNAWATFQRGEP
jgi:phage-related minor tail protein